MGSNKRKWINRDQAPRFSDPAEAVFEVKLSTGVVVKDCYFGQAKDSDGDPYNTFFTKDDAPIARLCITHYRRQV